MQNLTLAAWLRKVDAVLKAKTGHSMNDIADWCYADDYEEGLSPTQSAKNAWNAYNFG